MVSFGQKVLKTKCGIPTPLVETKLGSHKSLEPIIRCTKVIICIWSRADLIYGSDMCATLKKNQVWCKNARYAHALFYSFIYPFFLAPNWPGSMKRKKVFVKILIIFSQIAATNFQRDISRCVRFYVLDVIIDPLIFNLIMRYAENLSR